MPDSFFSELDREILLGTIDALGKTLDATLLPSPDSTPLHLPLDTVGVLEDNPECLRVFEKHTKLIGHGTHNCLTCRHLRLLDTQPHVTAGCRFFAFHVDQDFCRSCDMGNCASHEMIPSLDEPDAFTCLQETAAEDGAIWYIKGMTGPPAVIHEVGRSMEDSR